MIIYSLNQPTFFPFRFLVRIADCRSLLICGEICDTTGVGQPIMDRSALENVNSERNFGAPCRLLIQRVSQKCERICELR